MDVRGEVAPLLAAALEHVTTPQPIPELPPRAAEKSGNAYALQSYQLDLDCASLRFDAQQDMSVRTVGSSGRLNMPVGMDAVPNAWQ